MKVMDELWTQLTSHFLQNDNVMSKAELVETPNAGRGLVATQDLEKGEIIFAEKPLIVGPPQGIGQHFCVNCSQPLTAGVLQGKYETTWNDFSSKSLSEIDGKLFWVKSIQHATQYSWLFQSISSEMPALELFDFTIQKYKLCWIDSCQNRNNWLSIYFCFLSKCVHMRTSLWKRKDN